MEGPSAPKVLSCGGELLSEPDTKQTKVQGSWKCVVHIKCSGFVPGDAFGLKGLPGLDVRDLINQGLNEDKLANTRTFLSARR